MHDLLITRLQLSSKESDLVLERGDRPLMIVNSTLDLCVLIGNWLGVFVNDPEPLLVELELCLHLAVLDVLLKCPRCLGVIPLLKVAKGCVKDKPLGVSLLQEVDAMDLADRQLVELPRDKVLHNVLSFPGGDRTGVNAWDIDRKLGLEVGSGSHFKRLRAGSGDINYLPRRKYFNFFIKRHKNLYYIRFNFKYGIKKIVFITYTNTD